ncbi:unnamed protein product [Onchocerca flexuosa]|uniref:Peptidase_M24 domain-containing protein n=1 Tax=Onchocerca flexuosa TaxID=387005 RepID=A0A183H377_9BILA|nr:unnamed protein product [Onchocerca flexuosa]
MDVHDTASVARNIPLQAGVTFTVEPGILVINFDVRWSDYMLGGKKNQRNEGIYVRHDNEKVRKEFHGIGMRIEDDILLGSNGEVEVLTKDAVKDPESLELLMMTERVRQSNDDFCVLQNLSQ